MTIANARQAAPSTSHALRDRLRAARARTHRLTRSLQPDQLLGPQLSIVNPPLWELGHVGWFQERWCLRLQSDGALDESILPGADALYDSAAVSHDRRWSLPLPSLQATLEYVDGVLRRVADRLDDASDALRYFVELAVLHEEMHAEAFTYSRQTLGYPRPAESTSSAPCSDTEEAALGDVDVDVKARGFSLGAAPGEHFVFDNEKWAHHVPLRPFRIARTPMTNGDFLEFVEDGGYSRSELWSAKGWSWRTRAAAAHPLYWSHSERHGWSERIYDRSVPLVADWPVVHVNWFEAEAWCRWAARRLPTEAEWECAASTTPGGGAKTRYPWGESTPDERRANLYGGAGERLSVHALPAGDSAWGCRQMIGNVWEWTTDDFGPYPGFVVDPYKEYSAPWFGNHKVLRGGSHATNALLIHNTFRNFYTPDRRDVFAGFRTCAR